MLRFIAAIVAIISAVATYATSKPVPPMPPVDWESHMDTRFTPPIEKVVVNAVGRKRALDDAAIERYWAAWGPSALGHLQSMLHAPGWGGYEAQIARLFYRCPDEGATEVQREELLKPAARAAEALKKHETDRRALSQVSNHLWAGAGKKPALTKALLYNPVPSIRFQAASHLVQTVQSIPPEVETILASFSHSEDLVLQGYAVALLKKAPTEANLARAAQLQEIVDANKARHRAYWEKVYADGPEAAHLRGTIVDAQGTPLPGVTITFAIRRYDNNLEEMTSQTAGTSDAEGRFDIVTGIFGEATLRKLHVRRQYKYANKQDNVDEICTLLEPISPIAVMPGSSVDIALVAAVPDVTLIAGTITDENGVGLKPSCRLFTESEFDPPFHGMPFQGQFLFYGLPSEPFAIEFSLEGHQTRILQVDRDFQRGNRNITVVLPTTPYSDDVPIWTAVTNTPWTQESVDGTILGNQIRRHFDGYYARMNQSCSARNRFENPAGPVPVMVRMLQGPGDPSWVTFE